MLLLLLLGCVIGVHAYSEEPGGCDNFHKGLACPLNPGNIVSANSGLENEVLCQSACGEDDRCNFFTFMEFNTTRDSLCVLQVSCDVEAATFCNDEPGCSFAVAGPASPTILDVCCAEFEHKECDTDAPIATVPNVGEEWMCQELCRNDLTCSFYTLFINVCFLYTNCSTTSACGLCSSGSAFPTIGSCPQISTTMAPQESTSVLLLGGMPSIDSIELITNDMLSCEADLPPVPVETKYAESVMFNGRIFYCGGQIGQGPDTSYFDTCHSLDLVGDNINSWREEPTMTTTRSEFGMVTQGEKIYAIGGRKDWDNKHSSVESFHPSSNWTLEEDMTLGHTRVGHCSLSTSESLIVIAGFVNGYGSKSVMEFNLGKGSLGEWVSLADLDVPRYYPACGNGHYQGQEGIYVSGGEHFKTYITPEKSVEFYNPEENQWVTIHHMLYVRHHHTLTEVDGRMVAAGGVSYSNSIVQSFEFLDGDTWTLKNLTIARAGHSAVAIEGYMVKCKQ